MQDVFAKFFVLVMNYGVLGFSMLGLTAIIDLRLCAFISFTSLSSCLKEAPLFFFAGNRPGESKHACGGRPVWLSARHSIMLPPSLLQESPDALRVSYQVNPNTPVVGDYCATPLYIPFSCRSRYEKKHWCLLVRHAFEGLLGDPQNPRSVWFTGVAADFTNITHARYCDN